MLDYNLASRTKGKVALWADFKAQATDQATIRDLALFARVMYPLIWGRVGFLVRMRILFTGRLPNSYIAQHEGDA